MKGGEDLMNLEIATGNYKSEKCKCLCAVFEILMMHNDAECITYKRECDARCTFASLKMKNMPHSDAH